MSTNVSFETHQAGPRLRVELDGRPVTLPGEMESSLVAIRAYLEFLALQQRRVLSGFLVDGVEMNRLREAGADGGYQHVCGDTITFEELSHRLLATASRQIQRLASQMQEAVLRILISDREQIETQWREWQPQLRTPLVSLGFLRELWGPAVDALTVGGHSLAEHLEELNPLVCQIDAVFLATRHEWLDEDAIAVSTIVEESLVTWLKLLEVYLLKLHQQPLV